MQLTFNRAINVIKKINHSVSLFFCNLHMHIMNIGV